MNQAERTRRLLLHLHSAQQVIERHARDPKRFASFVGALQGMLGSMAGLDDSGLWPSVFDPAVTQAIRELLATIEGKPAEQEAERTPEQREARIAELERLATERERRMLAPLNGCHQGFSLLRR